MFNDKYLVLPSPISEYERRVKDGVIRKDDYQEEIVGRLQKLHDELTKYEQPLIPEDSSSSSSIVRLSVKLLLAETYNSHFSSRASSPSKKLRNRKPHLREYLEGFIFMGTLAQERPCLWTCSTILCHQT